MESPRYYFGAFTLVVVVLLLPFASTLAAQSPAAQSAPSPECESLKSSSGPVGPETHDAAKRLIDCAYKFVSQSDYRLAQRVFGDAVAMARRQSDRAALAEALGGYGLTFRVLGDAGRAETLLLESLKIAEELNHKDHMAEALTQLGRVRNMQARYEEARAYHLRSLAIWSEIDDKVGIAVALNNVGAMYSATGDYVTALEYYERSSDRLQASGDERRRATVLDNMGWIARRLGDSARGFELARQALDIRERFNDREGISKSLDSLSLNYQAAGNYAAALDALGKSLEIRTAIGAAHAIAEALNNIAVVYEAQGNYAQAEEYLRKSLAFNQEKVRSPSLTAEIYTHLGDVLFLQGAYARSAQTLKRSLAISIAAGYKPQAADAQLSLARVYVQLGHTNLAAQALQECLRFHESNGDRPARAEALVELADVERRRGRLTRGRAVAAEAVALADAMELPEVRWRALTAIGRIDVALRRPADARQAFDDAIAVVEDVRSLNPGGEETRSRFFESRLAPFEERITLALAAAATPDAFHFAERSKARALLDVIRGDGQSITKAMTEDERKRETSLRTSLNSANSEILLAARATPRDDSRIVGLKRKRDAARLAYEEFQARLYASHPDLRVNRAAAPIVRAREAQQLVPGPAAAIIEFVAGPLRTTAFVVTTSNVHVFTLPVGTAELGREVRRFREQVAGRDLRAAESARRLHDLVLGPMKTVLEDKQELIIVPDGILWDLPFQALRSASNRYLIEDAAVSYAPSVTVLRETMRARSGAQASRVLLAFGNPASPSGDEAVPLPEAENEVNRLGRMYGTSSRVYVGADAQEDRWKAEASDYRVVHLATHGVVDNGSPLYSHLVLARPERGAREDGLLEAWEIMNMQLRADLVVLSACETARGRVAAGEGVIGLMWALFVAGSPATLVSQWQVDSASTTALMVAFHQAWNAGRNRTSKSRALQMASVNVLRTAGLSHPFYWAGFILAGDGR